MAEEAQRRPRASQRAAESARAAAGSAPKPQSDTLRDVAVPRKRDIVPIWALILVFAVVEALVVWLMWPQFSKDWTAFQARRYEDSHRYEKAIPYLLKLVAKDPTSPTFLGELGNAYYVVKKYDEAIDYLKRAQENRTNIQVEDSNDTPPEPTDFSVTIGLAYMGKGDLANAEKYLKAALANHKQDKTANFAMGEVLFKQGKFREAGDYFKIVANDPGYRERVKQYYAEIEGKIFAKK